MSINIQSPKFHEVKAFDLFTRPNQVLTDILRREVNIFEERDLLYSFTGMSVSKLTPEERIQQILEHGTPRYYDEKRTSYTKNYPAGAFYATKNYKNLDMFFAHSNRHGGLLLIYEKQLLQTTVHDAIYTIKEGHTYPEALQSIIYPSYGITSVVEYSQIYKNIQDFIKSQVK